MSKLPSDLSLATLSIHQDDHLARVVDIAPPLTVSTNFEYPPADKLILARDRKISEDSGDDLIYSRFTTNVVQRAEAVLSGIFGAGAYPVTYHNGLAAFTAALFFFNPKKLAIGDGYHGCHSVAEIVSRLNGLRVIPLDSDEIDSTTLVHVETPINPTGYAIDLRKYAEIAHARGAKLLVDATFAPPPLQDPFAFGADMVMHSATKYFGGHSDLLAGVLVTKDADVQRALRGDRSILGTGMGNLEAWLLLRSMRTLSVRVRAQSASAEKIVRWLADNVERLPALTKVHHSSLQTEAFVAEQLAGGHSPTFSFEVTSAEVARALPDRLKLFHHATSLGGVESLIEWRAVTDPHVQLTLLRVSVGLEDPDDLIADLEQGLLAA
ncbi:pyridoxal phosphate-dependent transferase [Dipodascopsis tothii]|uniref:pyridoxal phosphate-dependent transferase n=1 Tax=Dipodascopsis tothii TaxID=44089 RepID=UPI0034CDDA1D